MSKIVSLINMKGGVGKTTLAVGLAWELAKNYKVLLVDVDPQFNATQWLVPTDTYFDWLTKGKTVFDVFQPEAAVPGGIGGFRSGAKPAAPSLKDAIISITHSGVTLDIVPSILDLMTLDAAPRGTENKLKVFLQQAKGKYDYILIDCPPTASLFSYSAYLASDMYLVPIKPDPLSVLGLPLLERAIEDYQNRSGHSLARLGLVLTQVRGTDAMAKNSAQLRLSYPGEVFKEQLPIATGVAEAVQEGLPLQEFHKTKNTLRFELHSMAAEFVKRAK
ncbi:Sporulation initiation inhibitor protein Soj [Xanthomonas sacchari]|uniref:ParA family protein n=1 Tax=Xanthomonas sacchari TaxID=56458 RepID=UPI0022513C67|nr:ParA family protein [Xanthomonas sacchari]MCW0404924.1 Sporulation initiation inhibitor protein Soj [Xanthomonas sacchari]MCW0414554.1 Sporulation initiation inhibitor protein Soj [Xanthomonas sacchari]